MFCVTIEIIGVVYAGRMGMLLKAHETKDKEVFLCETDSNAERLLH